MVGMQINTYIVAYLVLTSFFTALNLALNELNIVNVRLRWLFDSFNQLPQLQHSYVVLLICKIIRPNHHIKRYYSIQQHKTIRITL